MDRTQEIKMLVREILEGKRRKGEPLGVKSNSTLKDVIKVMVNNDTGSCVVFDDEEHLKGMVTFREILTSLHKDASSCVNTPVSEVMDSDPPIATPDDTVDQIRGIMTTKHIRYLPVMSEGKLTDVISFYDVARALAKQTDFENKMLKQYIHDWPDE